MRKYSKRNVSILFVFEKESVKQEITDIIACKAAANIVSIIEKQGEIPGWLQLGRNFCGHSGLVVKVTESELSFMIENGQSDTSYSFCARVFTRGLLDISVETSMTDFF